VLKLIGRFEPVPHGKQVRADRLEQRTRARLKRSP
jgi:hypothetical protein